MEWLDMAWFSRVQVGADIATGLTIIGALVSWLIKSRADARKERQRGINDAARAVAVENIQRVLTDLSKDFNQIVISAMAVEQRIDRSMSRDVEVWQNSLAERLSAGQLSLKDILSDLSRIREQISAFYEFTAASRYVLFPSLYSLPESKEVITLFKQEYSKILQVYNALSGSRVALLSELHALVSAVDHYRAEHPDHTVDDLIKTFQGQAVSIALDPDYHEWVATFIEPQQREAFKQAVAARNYENRDLMNEAVGGVLMAAISRGQALIGQVLIFTSSELQSARVQCKSFMIVLAAISARMQAKDNSQPVPKLIETLRSDDYFAAEREIR